MESYAILRNEAEEFIPSKIPCYLSCHSERSEESLLVLTDRREYKEGFLATLGM